MSTTAAASPLARASTAGPHPDADASPQPGPSHGPHQGPRREPRHETAAPAEHAFPFDALAVLPWNDPVVDPLGYDPRAAYVEHFWLGILGPSSVWLLRRIAAGFDAWPDGFELDLPETAAALGLGTSGRNSPFSRTLSRLIQFGMAQPASFGLAVRRRLPPLTNRQVGRLPHRLQDAHRAWVTADDVSERAHIGRERARTIARDLLAFGDATDQVEHHLRALGVHPAITADALMWALDDLAEPSSDAA